MIKKMKPLLVLGTLGLIMIVVYMIDLNQLNRNMLRSMIVSMMTNLVLMAYLLMLGLSIYKDSKQVLKSILYQLVPVLIAIVSIVVLAQVIVFNIKAPSLLDLVSLYVLLGITYLSPVLSYVVYYRTKK